MKNNNKTVVSPLTRILALVGLITLVAVPAVLGGRQPATLNAQLQYSDSLYASGMRMVLWPGVNAQRN